MHSTNSSARGPLCTVLSAAKVCVLLSADLPVVCALGVTDKTLPRGSVPTQCEPPPRQVCVLISPPVRAHLVTS